MLIRLTIRTILLPAFLHLVLAPADCIIVSQIPIKRSHDLLDVDIPVYIIFDNQSAFNVVVDDVPPYVCVRSPYAQCWGPSHILVSYVWWHSLGVYRASADLFEVG